MSHLSATIDKDLQSLVASANEGRFDDLPARIISLIENPNAHKHILQRSIRLLANASAGVRALGATLLATLIDNGVAANTVLDGAAATFRAASNAMSGDEARGHNYGRAGAATSVLAAGVVREAAVAGEPDAVRAVTRAAELLAAAAAERSYTTPAAAVVLADAMTFLPVEVAARVAEAARHFPATADQATFFLSLPDAEVAAAPTALAWTQAPVLPGAEVLRSVLAGAPTVRGTPHPLWSVLAQKAASSDENAAAVGAAYAAVLGDGEAERSSANVCEACIGGIAQAMLACVAEEAPERAFAAAAPAAVARALAITSLKSVITSTFVPAVATLASAALSGTVTWVFNVAAAAAASAVARCFDEAAVATVADSAAAHVVRVLLNATISGAERATEEVPLADIAAATADENIAVAAAAAAVTARLLGVVEDSTVDDNIVAGLVDVAYFSGAAVLRNRLVPALIAFNEEVASVEALDSALPARAASALAQRLAAGQAPAALAPADADLMGRIVAAINNTNADAEVEAEIGGALRALLRTLLLTFPVDETLRPAVSDAVHSPASEYLVTRLMLAIMASSAPERRAAAAAAFAVAAPALGDALDVLVDLVLTGRIGNNQNNSNDEPDFDNDSSSQSESEDAVSESDEAIDLEGARELEPNEPSSEADDESLTAAQLIEMYDRPAARIFALRKLERAAAAGAAASRRVVARLLLEFAAAHIATPAAWEVLGRLAGGVRELEADVRSEGAAATLRTIVAEITAIGGRHVSAEEVPALLVTEGDDEDDEDSESESEAEASTQPEGSEGMEFDIDIPGLGEAATLSLRDPRIDCIELICDLASDGRSAAAGAAIEILPLLINVASAACAATAQEAGAASVFVEACMGLIQTHLGTLAARIATDRVSAISAQALVRAALRAGPAAPFMAVSFIAGLVGAVTGDKCATEFTRLAGVEAVVALVNVPVRNFAIQNEEIVGDVARLPAALAHFAVDGKRISSAATACRKIGTAIFKFGDAEAWQVFVEALPAVEAPAVQQLTAWANSQQKKQEE